MPENMLLVHGLAFSLLAEYRSILEFRLLYQVLSYNSLLTSNFQPPGHTTSSFIPRTQLSMCLFTSWSVLSPRELSYLTLGMNSTHGQELSTKWTWACYFHKPPTPTCWLAIFWNFRRPRCSSPCVLSTTTLSPRREKEQAALCTAKRAPPDPEAWEFHPGERKQELPACSPPTTGSLFLIVLWRVFPSI